jgi:hypothetical protein
MVRAVASRQHWADTPPCNAAARVSLSIPRCLRPPLPAHHHHHVSIHRHLWYVTLTTRPVVAPVRPVPRQPFDQLLHRHSSGSATLVQAIRDCSSFQVSLKALHRLLRHAATLAPSMACAGTHECQVLINTWRLLLSPATGCPEAQLKQPYSRLAAAEERQHRQRRLPLA